MTTWVGPGSSLPNDVKRPANTGITFTIKKMMTPMATDDHGHYRLQYDALVDALRRAGYFGPFGLDAFHYRGSDGALRFHGCSDVNARFSMAWGIGMGGWRPSDSGEGDTG